MLNFVKRKKFILIDIMVVLLILLLPYYIFEGKLFIGGDETRLQYIYPFEWIRNIYFFSWYSYTPGGTFNSLQFTLPLLTSFGVLNAIIPSKHVINYLAFSAPLILGYIFFKKMMSELRIVKTEIVLTLGSLFYIFSPILLYKIISPFLFAAWLVGYLPLLTFLFLKYLRTGNSKYILINILISVFFSFCFNSIPWFLGALLPLGAAVPLMLLFSKKEIFVFLKRFIIFSFLLGLSQAFWLIAYVSSLLFSSGSYTSSILSESVKDSFINTVEQTSQGNNIIYPMVNLFHREIAIISNWPLKALFENYYDYIFLLNLIFPLIFYLGILHFKKNLNKKNRKIFLIVLFAFIASLFLFTVNIGPLKYLFLWMGDIPGFVMFRNFYGKFSLGYVLYYAALITLCLDLVLREYKNLRKYLLWIFAGVVLINAIPIKQTIDIPLWKTENVHTIANIPHEFMDFMDDVEKKAPSTTSLLSLPINIASYSIIKDPDSNNIFAGTSPIKTFSDVTTYSGDLSFAPGFGKAQIAFDINKWIQDRDYKKINNFLESRNIQYVMVTNNIPEEAKKSYLFNKITLPFQDQELVKSITNDKILVSGNGNYDLYKTKHKNILLSSKDLYFEKANPVKYRLFIKNLKENQPLIFLNTFNTGWKLFIQKNPEKNWCNVQIQNDEKQTFLCKERFAFIEKNDVLYSFIDPSFDSSHSLHDEYANRWNIDPEYIRKNYDESYFKINDDGSMDVEMVLYFVPQNYFYFGVVISLMTLICVSLWVFIYRK